MTIDMVDVNVFDFGIFTDMIDDLRFQIIFKVGIPVLGGPNGVNVNFDVGHNGWCLGLNNRAKALVNSYYVFPKTPA